MDRCTLYDMKYRIEKNRFCFNTKPLTSLTARPFELDEGRNAIGEFCGRDWTVGDDLNGRPFSQKIGKITFTIMPGSGTLLGKACKDAPKHQKFQVRKGECHNFFEKGLLDYCPKPEMPTNTQNKNVPQLRDIRYGGSVQLVVGSQASRSVVFELMNIS